LTRLKQLRSVWQYAVSITSCSSAFRWAFVARFWQSGRVLVGIHTLQTKGRKMLIGKGKLRAADAPLAKMARRLP
jgi:hypothetical protein